LREHLPDQRQDQVEDAAIIHSSIFAGKFFPETNLARRSPRKLMIANDFGADMGSVG
jgi:hypothetical protein